MDRADSNAIPLSFPWKTSISDSSAPPSIFSREMPLRKEVGPLHKQFSFVIKTFSSTHSQDLSKQCIMVTHSVDAAAATLTRDFLNSIYMNYYFHLLQLSLNNLLQININNLLLIFLKWLLCCKYHCYWNYYQCKCYCIY